MYKITKIFFYTVFVQVLLTLVDSTLRTENREALMYINKRINNTGAVFERVGNGQFYNKRLFIYANVDVPEYEGHLKILSVYARKIDNLCLNVKYDSSDDNINCATERNEIRGHTIIANTGPGFRTTSVNCSVVKSNNGINLNKCLLRSRILSQQLDRAEKTSNIIRHALEHHSRTGRALLNGIGNMLHAITGVMDNEDADAIYEKLKNMDNTQNRLVELSKDAVYVVGTLRKSVNESLKALHENQNQTRRTIDDIISNLKVNQKLRDGIYRHLDIVELIDTVHMELSEIENNQHELLSIMTSIQSGHLHPSIIGKEVMTEMYQKLSSKLKIKAIPDKLDLSRTFEIHGVLRKDSLIVRIGVPIPDQDVFGISRIYLLPQIKQGVAMIYDLETQYIASNAASTLFVNMNVASYAGCNRIVTEGDLPFSLCRQNEPILRESDESCVVQLYRNQQAFNQCNYKVVRTTEIFTQMVSENRWLYSFQSQQTLRIVTEENELEEIHLNESGTISVLCGGQLHFGSRVYGLSKINNAASNIDIKYPDVGFLPEFTSNMMGSINTNASMGQRIIKLMTKEEHNEGLLREGEQFNNWKNHLQKLEEHRATMSRGHYWYGGIFGTTCVLFMAIILSGWIMLRRYLNKNRTVVEHIELAERPRVSEQGRAHTFSGFA